MAFEVGDQLADTAQLDVPYKTDAVIKEALINPWTWRSACGLSVLIPKFPLDDICAYSTSFIWNFIDLPSKMRSVFSCPTINVPIVFEAVLSKEVIRGTSTYEQLILEPELDPLYGQLTPDPEFQSKFISFASKT